MGEAVIYSCVGGAYIRTYVADVVLCVTGNDACNNIPGFRPCVHFC